MEESGKIYKFMTGEFGKIIIHKDEVSFDLNTGCNSRLNTVEKVKAFREELIAFIYGPLDNLIYEMEKESKAEYQPDGSTAPIDDVPF